MSLPSTPPVHQPAPLHALSLEALHRGNSVHDTASLSAQDYALGAVALNDVVGGAVAPRAPGGTDVPSEGSVSSASVNRYLDIHFTRREANNLLQAQTRSTIAAALERLEVLERRQVPETQAVLGAARQTLRQRLGELDAAIESVKHLTGWLWMQLAATPTGGYAAAADASRWLDNADRKSLSEANAQLAALRNSLNVRRDD